MTQNIYAIYDEKAETYNAPFPLATDGLAKRSFLNACQNPNTDLYRYQGDFKLYCIATWDDSTGKFESIVPARYIETNKRQEVIYENETSKLLDQLDKEIEND